MKKTRLNVFDEEYDIFDQGEFLRTKYRKQGEETHVDQYGERRHKNHFHRKTLHMRGMKAFMGSLESDQAIFLDTF